jgi:hypothetical protein
MVEDVWLVSRYKHENPRGHIGLIWMSGKESGIYSVVDITSEPQMMVDSEQSAKYWTEKKYKGQLKLSARDTLTFRVEILRTRRPQIANNI